MDGKKTAQDRFLDRLEERFELKFERVHDRINELRGITLPTMLEAQSEKICNLMDKRIEIRQQQCEAAWIRCIEEYARQETERAFDRDFELGKKKT